MKVVLGDAEIGKIANLYNKYVRGYRRATDCEWPDGDQVNTIVSSKCAIGSVLEIMGINDMIDKDGYLRMENYEDCSG